MPSDKRQRKRERQQVRHAELRAAQRREQRRRRMLRVGVIAAVLVGLLVVLQAAGGDDDDEVATSTSTTAPGGDGPPRAEPVPAGQEITGDTPCPAFDGSSPRASKFEKAPPVCIAFDRKYVAVFDTSEGVVEVALDTETTPFTVNNFVVLARYHYYDGTAIHRTDTSIDIIQGGSPSTQSLSDPGPGYTIKDEGDATTRKYKPGDLVMARSQGPDSAGAQFFFVAGPKASALDAQGTYVTFGSVTQGLDVVQKILGLHQECVSGDDQCLGGAPSPVVTVKSVTIKEV